MILANWKVPQLEVWPCYLHPKDHGIFLLFHTGIWNTRHIHYGRLRAGVYYPSHNWKWHLAQNCTLRECYWVKRSSSSDVGGLALLPMLAHLFACILIDITCSVIKKCHNAFPYIVPIEGHTFESAWIVKLSGKSMKGVDFALWLSSSENEDWKCLQITQSCREGRNTKKQHSFTPIYCKKC